MVAPKKNKSKSSPDDVPKKSKKYYRPGSRRCCVVNCFNGEFANPDLKFHRFPGQTWEEKRRLTWIKAVRRQTENGKPWVPNDNHRICSAHFLGGEKSNDPRKEAYNPTLFPKIYKEREFDGAKSADVIRRKLLKEKYKKNWKNNVETELHHIGTSENVDKGFQTDLYLNEISTENEVVLFSSVTGNDVQIQTTIQVYNPRSRLNIIKRSTFMKCENMYDENTYTEKKNLGLQVTVS